MQIPIISVQYSFSKYRSTSLESHMTSPTIRPSLGQTSRSSI